ncbi:MAG: SOS response-associated peptidase [Bdellovibrio sp.]
MCARYETAGEFNLLEKTYRVTFPQVIALPKTIIYPHTPATVVLGTDHSLELRLMNYSLIPSWSKVRKPKFATYNARIEEVLNKPSWREPFKSNHCLVPIQNFIESVYTGPFAGHNISIEAKDLHLLSAAGIWDSWLDKSSGKTIESFAILTAKPPVDIQEAGHDRCPIFLKSDSWTSWLTEKMNPKDAVELLVNSREVVEFEFKEKEAIKKFVPQLSFFSED